VDLQFVEHDDRQFSFFYYSATLWPASAGLPDEMLGIGTWDLFRNFGRDFSLVFEAPKA
jgi:hypothetical protein